MTPPTAWSCRACCEKESRSYRYPAQPDLYCASCSQPMTLKEQEVTVLRLLLRAGHATARVDAAPMPAPSPTPEPELLSAEEAAELLRTSRKAIYAMAERRQLPGAVRIGRRLLVRRGPLLEWLSRKAVSSPEVRR